MSRIKEAEKLNRKVDKLLYNWDERSNFKISGVGNLSVSDLEIILMYTELIMEGRRYEHLVFYGSVAEVLKKHNLYEEKNPFGSLR